MSESGECRRHSREIHSLRLSGLYVDWTANVYQYQEMLSLKAVNIVDLAQARLNLALSGGIR